MGESARRERKVADRAPFGVVVAVQIMLHLVVAASDLLLAFVSCHSAAVFVLETYRYASWQSWQLYGPLLPELVAFGLVFLASSFSIFLPALFPTAEVIFVFSNGTWLPIILYCGCIDAVSFLFRATL